MSIRTKIIVNPSEELSSKPSKIESVLEDKSTKRITLQHKIRMIINKELNTQREEISRIFVDG